MKKIFLLAIGLACLGFANAQHTLQVQMTVNPIAKIVNISLVPSNPFNSTVSQFLIITSIPQALFNPATTVVTCSQPNLPGMGLGTWSNTGTNFYNFAQNGREYFAFNWGGGSGTTSFTSAIFPVCTLSFTGLNGNVLSDVQLNDYTNEAPAPNNSSYFQIIGSGGSNTGSNATELLQLPATSQFVVQAAGAAGSLNTLTTTGTPADAALSFMQSPGGVTGENLWLKGDAGTSTTTQSATVTTWLDQSNNTNNATQVTTGPQYNASVANYNPAVNMNASTNLQMQTPALIGKDAFVVANYTAGTVFGAYPSALTTTSSNRQLRYFVQSDQGTKNIYYSTSDVTTIQGTLKVNSLSTTAIGGALKDFHIFSLQANAATPSQVFNIGSDDNGTRSWTGNFSEIVVFPTSVSTNYNAVESYLAIKYGITMDPSAVKYINSANTGMYSIDATYKNQIIGIARDDISGLNQLQSHTTDDSLRIFTGASTVAASNLANTGTITNDWSSIVIGNDGVSSKATTAMAMPAGIVSRLGRTWKMTNTNFADNYAVEINWDTTGAGAFARGTNLTNARLLVASSASGFGTATIIGSPTVTFTKGSIIVSGINIPVLPANSTSFFTIGFTNNVLPLTITNFSAVKQQANNVLNWTVTDVVNFKQFQVQRLDANSTTFTTIATIPYEDGTAQYSFTDASITNSETYRLALVDIDGHVAYSAIVFLPRGGSANAFAIYKIYPVPTSGVLNVSLYAPKASNVTYSVIDLVGRTVKQEVGAVSIGSNSHAIDVSGLPNSTYILNITDASGTVLYKKFTKF